MRQKRLFKSAAGIILLLLILAVCMTVSFRFGSTNMSFNEFTGAVLNKPGFEKERIIIRFVRLPRILGAVIAGAGLSVSGVLLQSVTGNGLAGPNIIGVNSGAGLAVILLLFLKPSAAVLSPFAAFAGAFMTTLLIVSTASKIHGSGTSVILAGIAITALLNAAISFISLLDSDVLSSYNYFSIGGLSGVSIQELPLPGIITGACLIFAMMFSSRINALCIGDDAAYGVGVNVKALRTFCMILASASAAAVVSFAGLLGFVGLTVPHIAKKLCSESLEYLLPVSALCGAILVVSADLLGRVIFAPSEIPVGIIMAFIGAPFFFCLLLRRKSNDRI